MNYIVSGPGRVGMHLLADIIKRTGQTNVVATHDPALKFHDDLNTVLVVGDRRDRFAALLSNIILRHTGQSVDYPKSEITPFAVTPGNFKWEFHRYIDFYKQYDLSRLYAGVFKLYFEDFVIDHDHVRRVLNLPNFRTTEATTVAAPYRYEDIITNWFELKTLYLRLRVGEDVSDWN